MGRFREVNEAARGEQHRVVSESGPSIDRAGRLVGRDAADLGRIMQATRGLRELAAAGVLDREALRTLDQWVRSGARGSTGYAMWDSLLGIQPDRLDLVGGLRRSNFGRTETAGSRGPLLDWPDFESSDQAGSRDPFGARSGLVADDSNADVQHFMDWFARQVTPGSPGDSFRNRWFREPGDRRPDNEDLSPTAASDPLPPQPSTGLPFFDSDDPETRRWEEEAARIEHDARTRQGTQGPPPSSYANRPLPNDFRSERKPKPTLEVPTNIGKKDAGPDAGGLDYTGLLRFLFGRLAVGWSPQPSLGGAPRSRPMGPDDTNRVGPRLVIGGLADEPRRLGPGRLRSDRLAHAMAQILSRVDPGRGTG